MTSPDDHFERIYTAPFREPDQGGIIAGTDADDRLHAEASRPDSYAQGGVYVGGYAPRKPQSVSFTIPAPGTGRQQFAVLPTFRLPRTVQPTERIVPRFLVEPPLDVGTDQGASVVTDAGSSAAIDYLTSQVALLTTMITGATITAVCNEDGTITVTLTWGE